MDLIEARDGEDLRGIYRLFEGSEGEYLEK